MSANAELDSDDYVARLLAEDARKSSKRYATAGLSALLPKRPTKAALKPNTRFLSHIVREADSHNAALKKKEELESRIRLREMRERERNEVDQKDRGHDRKRRRVEEDDRRDRHRRRSRDRRPSASPSANGGDEDRTHRRKSRRPEEDYNRHSRSHRHRSHSRDRRSKRSEMSKDTTTENGRSPHRVRRAMHERSTASDSDPLEDLVGPLPPSSTSRRHTRGRRAHQSSKSHIDETFSLTYDPSLDVHPDSEPASEREDWDMALEALRDRVMWKKKQSERLREAGFGEDDIKKWEKTSTRTTKSGALDHDAGDVNTVRWAKKGEAREWDLGKEALDDG